MMNVALACRATKMQTLLFFVFTSNANSGELPAGSLLMFIRVTADVKQEPNQDLATLQRRADSETSLQLMHERRKGGVAVR